MSATLNVESRKALLAEARERGEAQIAAAEQVRQTALAEAIHSADVGEGMSVEDAIVALGEAEQD